MRTREPTTLDREQTIARIREVRAEHARAAQFYANRAQQARGSVRYGAVARWTDEYRRSAARCRLLGEMIRREREGT